MGLYAPRNLYDYILLVVLIWTLCFLWLRNPWGPRECEIKTAETPVAAEVRSSTRSPVKPKVKSDVAASGYWIGLGAAKQHLFDVNLSKALLRFLRQKKAQTILELGAGMGKYSETFMNYGFSVSCYDGNPNTQELSEGRCGVLDLSKPVHLSRHDWVLSLEVGEHIPREFEETFLNNLNMGNKHGVILSWAVEGQGGHSHVNCRNNSYIRNAMKTLGYSEDIQNENFLRQESRYPWFRNTIMVFTK